ncbi:hypothetical protein JD844_006090 [Phrynosoma platyrhinos]|uniref:Apolipoprotein C-II n=1 Tax=Phrynosoma platyrhinos TaxID=52577 RepID=A0ABQ7TQA9_PHRPL|nr:hypothetical protein JD844_006090 [Phrynosoma platyrhinos]
METADWGGGPSCPSPQRIGAPQVDDRLKNPLLGDPPPHPSHFPAKPGDVHWFPKVILISSASIATWTCLLGLWSVEGGVVVPSLAKEILGVEVSSYRLQKREAQEKEVLTQLQEAAKDDMYQKGYTAVNTYASIISDQIYHWWHGDE